MEVEEEPDQVEPQLGVVAGEQSRGHLEEHLEHFVAAVELPVQHTTAGSIARNWIR